jgi:hypothetical protein
VKVQLSMLKLMQLSDLVIPISLQQPTAVRYSHKLVSVQ